MLPRFLIVGVVGAFALAASSARGADRAPTGSPDQCIADSLGVLHGVPGPVPDCSADAQRCREACDAGDAVSCLGAGYALEMTPGRQDEARPLYRRACVLGLANACTNYAAGIWVRDHTAEQLACTQRIFEKACQAREAFACGMRARVILAESESPERREKARRDLEASCRELEGFPCRVLAKHLEAGDFGPSDPTRVRQLLEQACRSGDRDACGEPATAAETFDYRPAR